VRAALVVSAMIGISSGHQLLALDTLRDVPAQRVTELLRPALRALAKAQD
jgi:hypothetical protein